MWGYDFYGEYSRVVVYWWLWYLNDQQMGKNRLEEHRDKCHRKKKHWNNNVAITINGNFLEWKIDEVG